MKSMGCKQTTDVVMFEVEDEDHHSEKPAIVLSSRKTWVILVRIKFLAIFLH
jgi:hypothetical protein